MPRFRKAESESTQHSYFCTTTRKQKFNPSVTQLCRREEKKTSACWGRHGEKGRQQALIALFRTCRKKDKMQGMWFILAAALLTQLLWELPSITCTVQVVILSIIIPTCRRAAVGLLSPITPPLPTHLHSWSPARYWPPYPPKKVKGAGRDSCLLTATDFRNSYSLSVSLKYTLLRVLLQYQFISHWYLQGTNTCTAHLPDGGESNQLSWAFPLLCPISQAFNSFPLQLGIKLLPNCVHQLSKVPQTEINVTYLECWLSWHLRLL